MVEPHLAGLVAVPFVTDWRADDDPYSKAAHVLRAASALPKSLRDFAAAMAQLATEVNALLQPASSSQPRPVPEPEPEPDLASGLFVHPRSA
jgi:hypothetical protein